MADVEEIIDYIKSLKKGFDKDLFQSKINELAHVVDTTGLEQDDFHTLFKVWLNLSIPITKWVSLGACLVPADTAEERTVDYAFRWLLASCDNHSNFSRMSFLLDWLTAAMDSDTIDMAALDSGYEIFYSMLAYEVLTAHTIKLVYTLTKPSDVTRRRVIELLDYAKKREGKKNMLRQIQVLLGLLKSYKPECVPEDVPAISVHTTFRKINVSMLARFKRGQERRNCSSKERHHLLSMNPLNMEGGRNRKADPLVPKVEFLNLGSRQYADKESQKTCLDFSDPVSLLQCAVQRGTSRPARLRALLCNEAGVTLLAVAAHADHAFLDQDLAHLLSTCFLDASPHSYAEKQDLLHRLAVLQRTLLQGIPAVTRFLARYLPLWNEKDYFGEIMELVEWINVDSPDQVAYILEPLTRIHHRAQPMEQCAILKSLTNMYANLVYSSTRSRQHFMSARKQNNIPQALPLVASSISDLCNKALQISPEDMRVVYSGVTSAEGMARAALRGGRAPPAPPAPPRPLALALPLLAPSALLLDKLAALMILYRKLFSMMKASNQMRYDQTLVEQRKTLENFSFDLISCLYNEEAFTGRKSGLVFNHLHPQLVSKLGHLVPDADGKFSLRNGLAFAAYTYTPFEAVPAADFTNKLCFDTVVAQSFPNLGEFMAKMLPELR